MSILKSIARKKNTQRLLRICESLIGNYEAHELKPSSKQHLLPAIQNIIDRDPEVPDWKDYDTDYIELAHMLLAQTTFDLLASGRFHLYHGILNPMSCASNIMDVYNSSMTWGVNKNLITQETKEEQAELLRDAISRVG